MNQTPHDYLKNYVSERLALLTPAIFEEGADIPSFTTDQRSKELQPPPYPA